MTDTAQSRVLWKRMMHGCIIKKTEICVISESGPVAVTVNAASLALFELTAVWPVLIFHSLPPKFVM